MSARQMMLDLLGAMQADAVTYLSDNDCSADWFVNRMLMHLDGPQQRTAQAALEAEIARAVEPVHAVITALRFYANGDHYNLDGLDEFDTVSGEPQNWLCSGRDESATMIEDGTIARRALRGEQVEWIDGGEDATPQPIDGEIQHTAPQQAAINAEMLEALQGLHDDTADYIKRNNLTGLQNHWMVAARAAIAKAAA